MFLFLHEKGYTFFTVPKLTYPEINALVDSVNRRNKKQEANDKKMARQNKAKGRRR